LDIKVGSLQYLANGNAIALGAQDDLMKTIYDEYDRRVARPA
jgi:hypothetical protein